MSKKFAIFRKESDNWTRVACLPDRLRGQASGETNITGFGKNVDHLSSNIAKIWTIRAKPIRSPRLCQRVHCRFQTRVFLTPKNLFGYSYVRESAHKNIVFFFCLAWSAMYM